MARIAGGRQWPDGDRIWLNVKADDEFPESLLQAKIIAADLFREMVGVVILGHDGNGELHDLDAVAAEFGIDLAADELGGD